MRQQNELVKGSVDSLLLCLIGQQLMYGYKIIKELEDKSQGYFKSFGEHIIVTSSCPLRKMVSKNSRATVFSMPFTPLSLY
jgi:hypothetical protein